MSYKYFNKLNYTMSNEDTEFEYSLLSESVNHVLTIAGSGSRVIPLLAKKPKMISICDYSIEQLALTATRIETVKEFTHLEFLGFWGYQEILPDKRKQMFDSLTLPLNFKEIMEQIFNEHKWSSLLYVGKYEMMLISLSSIIQKVMGKHILKLASFTDHNKFIEYLYTKFPKHRWRFLVTILGNSTMLNALLYKGKHPKKNIKTSYSSYYREMFNNLFQFLLPKDSFLLQMIFFGKVIFLEGAPFETNPKIFNDMKKSANSCKISYYCGDLFDNLEKIEEKIDFVSFSDILSYFPSSLEKVYLQKIKPYLSPKAITVHRYYFRINKDLDITGFTKTTDQHLTLIEKEKTQIYIIDTYEKENE
jgi:S-adenosylmethionine-diacylglycerol 3-amino-3-carboxypropyl transferase